MPLVGSCSGGGLEVLVVLYIIFVHGFDVTDGRASGLTRSEAVHRGQLSSCA